MALGFASDKPCYVMTYIKIQVLEVATQAKHSIVVRWML